MLRRAEKRNRRAQNVILSTGLLAGWLAGCGNSENLPPATSGPISPVVSSEKPAETVVPEGSPERPADASQSGTSTSETARSSLEKKEKNPSVRIEKFNPKGPPTLGSAGQTTGANSRAPDNDSIALLEQERPQSPATQRSSLVQDAEQLMAKGDYEGAFGKLRSHLVDKPGDLDANRTLAYVSFELDRPARAIPHLDRAMKFGDPTGELHALKGLVEFKLARYASARALLRKGVDLGQRQENVLMSLAIACWTDNAFSEAGAAAQMVLDEAPNSGEAWYILAAVKWRTDDLDGAAADLKKARAGGAKIRQVEQLEEAIEAARSHKLRTKP